MAYLGNRELSIEAQDRVMSAFRKVISNLQQRQRQEALIGLEFVLRVDPLFRPAIELRRQLQGGAEAIDLSDLIAQIEAPTTDTINELLVEAVEDFNNRNFVAAKSKVERVLLELPGHQEARRLLNQLQESLKVEQQVGQFLTQAREALAIGDPQEAANFVLMAQALDPHHSGIASTLHEIYASSGTAQADASAARTPRRPAGSDAATAAASDGVKRATAAVGASGSHGAPAEPPWGSSGDELFGDGPDAAEFPAPDFGAEPLRDLLDADFGEPGIDLGEPPADDLSDLFEAAPRPGGAAPSSGQPIVAQLLARGAAALDAGQYVAAIDAWSRIWLEEPTNEEVGPRVAEAKKRLEQAGRELEHLLFEAEDALIGGDSDKALNFVNRVLTRHPGHREALALHRRLSGEAESSPAAPPAAAVAPAMPELEEDLFSEPFASFEAAPAEAPLETSFQPADEVALPSPARRLLALSPRTLALAAAIAVVLVVAGGLGVRAILGARTPTAENDVYVLRTEADELYKQGKPAAALQLVEGFKPRHEGDEKIVSVLLAKYRAALATPTPTPVPAIATKARSSLDAGLWFRAYDEAKRGLETYPGDGGLLEIVDQVEGREPQAATLSSQLAGRNPRGAVGTTHDLLIKHPGQPDLVEVLERSLFNAALAELRTYNLTGARSHLDELVRVEPNDEEVNRVLEFIDSYKARPVDMQLKVFIQSLPERLEWSAPVAPPADVVQPTPTPAATA
jgi:tetratricopeptide (TPR) repeat protein